jgi:outer membrane protein assembly factor BamB
LPGEREEHAVKRPYVAAAAPDWDPGTDLRVRRVDNPLADLSLGAVAPAARVSGAKEFPATVLFLPVEDDELEGLDPATIRLFRVNARTLDFDPVWSSGVSAGLGFAWAHIAQSGTYAAVGIPRDPFLRALLRDLAVRRRLDGPETPARARAATREGLAVIREAPPEQVEELRARVAQAEIQADPDAFMSLEVERGAGATIAGYRLPGDASLEELRQRIEALEPLPGGLPEEALFFAPDPREPGRPAEAPVEAEPVAPPAAEPADGLDVQRLLGGQPAPLTTLAARAPIGSPNWWMYHGDAQHTGHVTGSHLSRMNIGHLRQRAWVPLDGPVVSVPSVVANRIYVGTGNSRTAPFGSGGTLYRINLLSGVVERTFTVSTPLGGGARQGLAGIACTPAVSGGRVYFSALNGRVYCLDAATLAPLWVTNLRRADPSHNQPVTHQVNAEGWSSPLVVDDRVYVGCGEGELGSIGFVYCLNARTGDVIWLFCTCQMPGADDNEPNVIPSSMVGLRPLPPPFHEGPEPLRRGAHPWSSCAYDPVTGRVVVGTGTMFPHERLPQPKYSLGVLSLDAATGGEPRFFQPDNADNYRPDDDDTDVPAGPVVYLLDDRPVVAVGTKGGSFFVLDSDGLAPLARRQLLPRAGGNGGFPGDTGNRIPAVDPHPVGPGGIRGTENFYGTFGAAGVDFTRERLFVGVGGFHFGEGTPGIDSRTTAFLRALNWDDLTDAWITATGPDRVRRYVVPAPPLYANSGEAGFASPVVVNDLVLTTTSRPALYALDAATGVPLWSAPGFGPPRPNSFTLGPAVFGDYLVVGSANLGVLIYSL